MLDGQFGARPYPRFCSAVRSTSMIPVIERSMDVEAILLTGGASRRMGADKASIVVGDAPIAERILAEFDRVGVPVTVLGRAPIGTRPFLQDREEFRGPASALAHFVPSHGSVFVCSCDIPGFDADVVPAFLPLIVGRDAVIPTIGGHEQYLCAMYASHAFSRFRQNASQPGTPSMKRIIAELNVAFVDEKTMRGMGLAPSAFVSANTPEELDDVLKQMDERGDARSPESKR